MPHVSEFHATGDHDRHDVLLVAALAAGDLSGIDRDHALDLTRSCATCADLHDDLVAIARATASVPPPVTARPRDFRLTPADAARLRPAGWRRLLRSFAGAPSFASRPLGVGLATLGLVGLLIGNAPVLSLGSGASMPGAATGGATGQAAPAAQPAASAAAASAGPVEVQAAPGASAATTGSGFGTSLGGGAPSTASRSPQDRVVEQGPTASVTLRGADAGGAGKSEASGGPDAVVTTPDTPSTDSNPLRPLNLLFGAAVLVGLGLLVASRLRSRSIV